MSFFTDGPRERPLFPVREQELFSYEGRPWMGPPSDHIVPALLPWAVPLGRSERTIVALRGIEVWPEAMTLRLAVYSRDSLHDGRTGSLIDHRRIPDYNALLIGVLYPDGSRASSETISVPSASEPDRPVLRAQGGGGTQFHFDHQVFVWPLPRDGTLTLVVQWLDRGISETHTALDGAAVRAAAHDAGELWPGLTKRPGNGVAVRQATATSSVSFSGSGYGVVPPVVATAAGPPAEEPQSSLAPVPLPQPGAAPRPLPQPGGALPPLPQPDGAPAPLPQRNVAPEALPQPGAAPVVLPQRNTAPAALPQPDATPLPQPSAAPAVLPQPGTAPAVLPQPGVVPRPLPQPSAAPAPLPRRKPRATTGE